MHLEVVSFGGRVNSRLTSGDPDIRNQHSGVPPCAHFDYSRGAWIFSRYGDVQAALREPLLHPDGGNSTTVARSQIISLISSFDFEKWREGAKSMAALLDAALGNDSPIDLLRHVIRPWCLSLSVAVLRLSGKAASRLGTLAPYLTGGAEDGSRLRRRIADWKAAQILNSTEVPGAKSIFLGITQTLHNFIANSWIFMLEHPEMLAVLRQKPGLASRVLEELLRSSGPVHTLVRKAEVPLRIANIHIHAGQRVILKISEANRDPNQFPPEEELHENHRPAGHLALGADRTPVPPPSLSAQHLCTPYENSRTTQTESKWRDRSVGGAVRRCECP